MQKIGVLGKSHLKTIEAKFVNSIYCISAIFGPLLRFKKKKILTTGFSHSEEKHP
jgi:hypothetical protein